MVCNKVLMLKKTNDKFHFFLIRVLILLMKISIILNMEIALEYLTKKEVRLALLAKKFQEDINYLNIS